MAVQLERREAFRLGPSEEGDAIRMVAAPHAIAVLAFDGQRSTVRVYAAPPPVP